MQFRKKPVVIEAEEFRSPFPLPFSGRGDPVCYDGLRWYITTLEGDHTVSEGDMVIKGVKGEFYPCKPDIFAMTYERADALTGPAPLIACARAVLAAADKDVGVARLSDGGTQWVCPKCGRVTCAPSCTRNALLGALDALSNAIAGQPAAPGAVETPLVDALEALRAHATPGRWHAFQTGVLSGSKWVIGNNPSPDGRIMSAADAAYLDEVLRLASLSALKASAAQTTTEKMS